MWCDVSGSGSVVSELKWWLELGMMHHLDQTLIGHLHRKGQSGEFLTSSQDNGCNPSPECSLLLNIYSKLNF